MSAALILSPLNTPNDAKNSEKSNSSEPLAYLGDVTVGLSCHARKPHVFAGPQTNTPVRDNLRN